MKRLLPLFLLLPVFTVQAQSNTYTAKDGTRIEVTQIDADPTHIYKMSANLGMYGMEGLRFYELNYYEAKKYYISASVGTANYLLEGNLFFANRTREKDKYHTVKQTNRAKYLVKLPIEKQISYGVHLGAGYVDMTKEYNTHDGAPQSPFTTSYILAGLTILNARQTHFQVEEYRPLKLHLITRLNADVVYYFNRKLKPEVMTDGDTKTLDDYSRKLGFRFYYSGRNSWYAGKGHMGLSYLIGAGINSYKGQEYTVFAGLGIFYAFWDR